MDKKPPRYLRMVPAVDPKGRSFELLRESGQHVGCVFDSPSGAWHVWVSNHNDIQGIRARGNWGEPWQALPPLCNWVSRTTQMLIVVN